MHANVELWNLKCLKAASKTKPYRIPDSGGLALLVTPEGGKLWRWRYHFEGKMKQMAFGKYPDVPLADARAHHAQARQLLANGVGPMALRKDVKEKAKVKVEQPKEKTLEYVIREWLKWWRTDKNDKYAANVESRLESDIIAKVGSKIPAEITRMELVKLTQDVDARGARDIARRNLQIVRQIYEWGTDNRLLDQNTMNPAAGIKPDKILSRVVEEHFASVPISEVPELLRKMRDYDGTALTRISGAYNYAEYLEPRAKRLQDWSDFLDEQLEKARTQNDPASIQPDGVLPSRWGPSL
jgi:hypothetical protein